MNQKCNQCNSKTKSFLIECLTDSGKEQTKGYICLDCLAEKLEFRIEQIRDLKRDQVKEMYGNWRFH